MDERHTIVVVFPDYFGKQTINWLLFFWERGEFEKYVSIRDDCDWFMDVLLWGLRAGDKIMISPNKIGWALSQADWERVSSFELFIELERRLRTSNGKMVFRNINVRLLLLVQRAIMEEMATRANDVLPK